MRTFITEQVVNTPFWASRSCHDVTLLGSATALVQVQFTTVGRIIWEGIFWASFFGNQAEAVLSICQCLLPTPSMTSPEPSSNVQSGAVNRMALIHPTAEGSGTENMQSDMMMGDNIGIIYCFLLFLLWILPHFLMEILQQHFRWCHDAQPGGESTKSRFILKKRKITG